MVDASRRSTRSSFVDKPAPTSPESASTSRPTSASSMNGFAPSPAKSASKSPKRITKRKSKPLSPEYDETPRQATRRSARKISPSEPVYEVEDTIDDPLEFIQTPATNEELEAWKGWVELESEPVSLLALFCSSGWNPITWSAPYRDTALTMVQAFFNVMLRDLGVEGVKIQEVFSLDEEMLEMIP